MLAVACALILFLPSHVTSAGMPLRVPDLWQSKSNEILKTQQLPNFFLSVSSNFFAGTGPLAVETFINQK